MKDNKLLEVIKNQHDTIKDQKLTIGIQEKMIIHLKKEIEIDNQELDT